MRHWKDEEKMLISDLFPWINLSKFLGCSSMLALSSFHAEPRRASVARPPIVMSGMAIAALGGS